MNRSLGIVLKVGVVLTGVLIIDRISTARCKKQNNEQEVNTSKDESNKEA
jgi:hypothetical protein